MANFELSHEHLIPLDDIPDKKLSALVAYWNEKRGSLPFAPRKAIDPLEIAGLLGHVRLVDIEPGGVFRFRLYGSAAINPDRRDMTGKTTRDYADKAFGDLVTRHYSEVARDGVARCWRVVATVDAGAYEYLRVVLPISRSGDRADALLVLSAEIENAMEIGPLAH